MVCAFPKQRKPLSPLQPGSMLWWRKIEYLLFVLVPFGPFGRGTQLRAEFPVQHPPGHQRFGSARRCRRSSTTRPLSVCAHGERVDSPDHRSPASRFRFPFRRGNLREPAHVRQRGEGSRLQPRRWLDPQLAVCPTTNGHNGSDLPWDKRHHAPRALEGSRKVSESTVSPRFRRAHSSCESGHSFSASRKSQNRDAAE